MRRCGDQGARDLGRVRQDSRDLRGPARIAPGHPMDAGRERDRYPYGEMACAGGGVQGRQRRAVPHRIRLRQAGRCRGLLPRGRPLDADPRCARRRQGPAARALVPGDAHPPHRRGAERSAEARHRARHSRPVAAVRQMTGQEQRWPLEGVRVLDLGQLYNGPYDGFLLAHAGADVVKVEPPGGEALRDRGGGQPWMALAMLNTRQRGITINLKSERGRALLFDLARQADVFLENFAPGALARLGVRAEDLMAANPRLIYASGTGYGLSGPSRDNLAMDLTVQAVGGVMSINGTEDGPPLKAGLAICDFLGAVHLYSGIMTALYERSVTGRGRFVEVAMQEALYPALASNIAGL